MPVTTPSRARRRSTALTLAVALTWLAAGCSSEPTREQAATAAFERFQDALFAGDRSALRHLLSSASREALSALPLQRVQGQQRLRVVGAERRDPEVLLAVLDPNQGDSRHTWVMVREDGRMRVDLIGSTAYNHTVRPGEGGPRFEPRQLDRAELAKIRARWPARCR